MASGERRRSERRAEVGGKVLLIGVGFSSNTSCHCAEEQIPDSCRLSPEPVGGVVVLDGREIIVRSRLHVWGHRTDFTVLESELEALGRLRRGLLGSAPALCLEAKGFLELALSRLAANARYFVAEK